MGGAPRGPRRVPLPEQSRPLRLSLLFGELPAFCVLLEQILSTPVGSAFPTLTAHRDNKQCTLLDEVKVYW